MPSPTGSRSSSAPKSNDCGASPACRVQASLDSMLIKLRRDLCPCREKKIMLLKGASTFFSLPGRGALLVWEAQPPSRRGLVSASKGRTYQTPPAWVAGLSHHGDRLLLYEWVTAGGGTVFTSASLCSLRANISSPRNTPYHRSTYLKLDHAIRRCFQQKCLCLLVKGCSLCLAHAFPGESCT